MHPWEDFDATKINDVVLGHQGATMGARLGDFVAVDRSDAHRRSLASSGM